MSIGDLDSWLEAFSDALTAGDVAAVSSLFRDECYWRDMLAFTWNIHTCEGRYDISRMLESQLAHAAPRSWERDGPVTEHPDGWLEAWLTFETAHGYGKAHVRLVDGRCYTLLTTLVELRGHPPAIGRQRERGQTHGMVRGRKHWAALSHAQHAEIGVTRDPYCVIIGGGQGGLALAARLKQLGVPTLVVEKNPNIGDSWRHRYPSLCLHDPVWYDHMPFIPFPPDWPVFTPKDRMGDWLEMYARVMDLTCWTNANCTGAIFDEASGRWSITVERNGRPTSLGASQLVFATGMSGYPNTPEFQGRETFRGGQMHSSAYPCGQEVAGRRCVVIGSNTSAHDICADLWEQGAVSVTMVQRSGTMVVSTDAVLDLHLAPLYSEDALERGIDTETADYVATTWPHRVIEQRGKAVCAAMRERDRALLERLSAAGFMLDFGPDDTGLALKSIREGGGFYINVGASELICDGDLALRSGVGVERLVEDGVVLTDGTHLPADLVVYATGYRSMNEFVADVVGREIADRVGRCWGVGSGIRKDPGPWEGELRNMWKPTRQRGLWFQGGNLAQSRHFSRFLAMQIKARMEGMDIQVFPADGKTTGRAASEPISLQT